MNKVLFSIDIGSLQVSSSGAITANIWLEIGGHEFPMRNWNDFAVVIMGWWANALLRLLKKSSNQELIDFMEGPYVVEIRSASLEKFAFRGLQGINRNLEVAVSEAAVMPFINEFICHAQKLLGVCRDRNLRTDDVETLEVSLSALNREYFRALYS